MLQDVYELLLTRRALEQTPGTPRTQQQQHVVHWQQLISMFHLGAKRRH